MSTSDAKPTEQPNGLLRVRLADLVVDPSLNPRPVTEMDSQKEGESMDALIASMRENGQISPVLVDVRNEDPGDVHVKCAACGHKRYEHRPNKGSCGTCSCPAFAYPPRYRLRDGFRRAEAARRLGWDELDAKLWDRPEDAGAAAIAANRVRKNASVVADVLAIRKLADEEGLSNAKIGAKVGLAPNTVENYLRLARRLRPEILRAWERRPGLFSRAQLEPVVKMAPAAQLTWLHGVLGKAIEADAPKPEAKKPVRRSVPVEVVTRLIGRIDAGKYDHRGATWCDAAREVLSALAEGRSLK